MSRKMLRRPSVKNSPLLKQFPPSKKSSIADAFLFTEEPIHGFISPGLDNSGRLRKKNAAQMPNPSTNTKVSRNALEPASDDNTFTVPNKTASTEERTKKVKRKKKIRYTEDLNAVELGDVSSFIEVKTKSKKTKRARLPSFLPPVDTVEEDNKSHSSTSASDSNNKENECDAERKLRPKRGRSGRTKKDTESESNLNKLTNKGQEQEDKIHPKGSRADAVAKSAHIRYSNSGSSVNCSARSSIESDKAHAATNTSKLKREGTFEISSADRVTLFSQTCNVVSSQENKTPSTSKNCIETIDLTESIKKSGPRSAKKQTRGNFEKPFVDKGSSHSNKQTDHYNIACNSSENGESSVEAGAISSNKKSILGTATKKAEDNRKSSFEVSFNVNKNKRNYSSNEVLDNLNITSRDSRKTSVKKSSTGASHGCLDDKRPSDLSKSHSVAKSELGKKSISKKSILKKPFERFTKDFRRDTFELVEGYYEILDKVQLQSIPATSTISEDTLNNTSQKRVLEDIFDVVSKTPTLELGHMMIGSGESVLVTDSFVDNTKSVAPVLARMNTFTKDKETSQSPRTVVRRSSRKRWSQVERTPVFNKMPKVDGNESKFDFTLDVSKGKSVTFQSTKPESDLTVNKMKENVTKRKKSVKIESPLSTPKMRLHSPLVIRKTPNPNKATNTSILAGNCAALRTRYISPPSCSSTPYLQEKETSLKTAFKVEKSIKSSSRVKMPDFRKIHEKQFNKMENIREFQERKALRAQYLMSGHKTPTDISASIDIDKQSRKKLHFTEKYKPNIQPSAPNAPKNISNQLSKPSQYNMPNKRTSIEKQAKDLKTKLPVMFNRVSRLRAGQPKTHSQNAGISKPVQNMLNKRASLEKKNMVRNQESKVVTRFGFKMSAKEQLTKEEQIKAVSLKSKLTTNRREQNRQQFGVVRTNRRFELLMQMRARNA